MVPSEEELHTIREQLAHMRRLIGETPNDKHVGISLAGRMPAHPLSFTPKGWQTFNPPIWDLWRDYLALLDQLLIDLHAYRESARKLDVANLLAASKEESER